MILGRSVISALPEARLDVARRARQLGKVQGERATSVQRVKKKYEATINSRKIERRTKEKNPGEYT